MRPRSWLILGLVLALLGFLAWRMLRPMNIFVVTEAFERPIPHQGLPASVTGEGSQACVACHEEIHAEWSASMHSRAWTDPYFQKDWEFDGARQVCKNCHVPLENQQEQRVVGFRDRGKEDPILEPNAGFDAALQREGVTCAACHLREGRILGPYGDTRAPHAVAKMDDPNRACVRCHVVEGDRWDTFFRMPPCGTVAEIESSGTKELGCVQCHMPAVRRTLVAGGTMREVRRHLWRGGHDPAMVQSALKAELTEESVAGGKRLLVLTLTNVGARHFLPTGTPDRHLMVTLRLLDANDRPVRVETHKLIRTVMWRPFIVDLWDTRLPYQEPRRYALELDSHDAGRAYTLEAVVRYGLLEESRRRRIGYENREPISYEIYHARLKLKGPAMP
jgi:hypothetical protein